MMNEDEGNIIVGEMVTTSHLKLSDVPQSRHTLLKEKAAQALIDMHNDTSAMYDVLRYAKMGMYVVK